MKTVQTPTSTALNILGSNLTDNQIGMHAARRIAKQTLDQIMASTTRQPPAKHKQTIKTQKVSVVKAPAPAKTLGKSKSVVPSSMIRLLEEYMDLRLTELGNKLLSEFDLSREGLAHVTTDMYLPLMSDKKSGGSKTGGDKSKTGKVAFERYISVRHNDCMVKFACLLLDPTDPRGVLYQVEGPEEHFPRGYKRIDELRPYLPKGTKVGANKGGWEYRNFNKAAEKFAQIIASFAHRKH